MHESTGSLSSTGRSRLSDATAATALSRVSALGGVSPTGSVRTTSMEAGSVPASLKPSPAAIISSSLVWTVSSVRR